MSKHNRARHDKLMTLEHSQWSRFIDLLRGKEGCDFQGEPPKTTWRCLGYEDKSLSKSILLRFFPKVDIKSTMEYFERSGGFCDCEVVFNIA